MTDQLLASVLGGGIAIAVFNAFNAAFAVRDSRRIAFVQDQLEHLYGPLFYLASQNRKLIEHSGKINAAYTAVYCETNWSSGEATQKSISDEANTTIQINNQYSTLVWANNDQIVAALAEHYRLIDLKDESAFQDFVLANTRAKIEYKSGKPELPRRLLSEIGNVAYYEPGFVERIERQFTIKRAEIEAKQHGICWRTWKRISNTVNQWCQRRKAAKKVN